MVSLILVCKRRRVGELQELLAHHEVRLVVDGAVLVVKDQSTPEVFC